MTSKEEIRDWFQSGVRQGATHMIVACDTFKYEDFPVYVHPGENPKTRSEEYNNPPNMLKLMEVYALHLDMEEQLAEFRAMHFDPPPSSVYERLLKEDNI
jgi:hypothetical protein